MIYPGISLVIPARVLLGIFSGIRPVISKKNNPQKKKMTEWKLGLSEPLHSWRYQSQYNMK